jgi:hypothetical protein
MKDSPSVKTASVADRTGTYSVWSGGQQVTGVIVPRVITLEGEQLDAQVFLGEGEHAFQDKIAGVLDGEADLGEGSQERGLGVFVFQVGDRAVATEPVRIVTETTLDKVATLHGERMRDGSPLRIRFVDGLKKLASFGGGEYAIPSSFKFFPLRGKQIKVASVTDSTVQEHSKIASIHSVKLISDGSTYNLRGATASSVVNPSRDMGVAETEFVLGALGLTEGQSRNFMKTAALHGEADIMSTRAVVPAAEAQRRAEVRFSKVASVGNVNALRTNLVREIAILAEPMSKTAGIIDKETVDAVLALNFVTPENASIYVDYLSDLEKVSSQLAEILVASRLGMDDVREAAAKNAMSQVDSVARGLRQLKSKIS